MKKIDFKLYLEKFKNANKKEFLNSFLLNLKFKKKLIISQKQKIIFFDNLYNLVNSGIPITNSLGIMLLQTKDKNIKNILMTISKDLSKGLKLQDSLKKYEKIFSTFDVYMVKMGEITGKLANSFDIIKTREEKNADLKAKIFGALIYPIIIIILSVIMIIGFMLFVIPRVQKMYIDARINLPDLTQKVIDISNFLQNNYISLIFIILFFIFTLLIFKKNKRTKIYYDKYILKIPLFGGLIKKRILSIFSSTLGTLLQNGIIINESLNIAKNSLENAYYEKRLDEIIERLNEGIHLSELMGIKKLQEGKEDDCFPIELASAVKIGEQTGKLPNLLINISNKFNREIDIIVKNLSTAIEPIVIIFVGIIVGTMIMAILLPFFNMVNVL